MVAAMKKTKTIYLQRLRVAPEGNVTRTYFRADPGAEAAWEPVSKAAFFKGREADHTCLVEVFLPVLASSQQAAWLAALQHPAGGRWVMPKEGELAPAEADAPTGPEAIQVGGVTADGVARAAHDLWIQKRRSLNLSPAPAWEALSHQERMAKLDQARQILQVIAHAEYLQSQVDTPST